ncbi:MAG: (4Fe-4S)-binding protein [Desulfotomaculaceae bacterium]|nr:(4Fe-4S)-binding protein [Desulfotomaculaceae bacterium]
MGELVKKKVKVIKVNLGKCNGCRYCEIACAAFHANPRYSSINPARSRIRVVTDIYNDELVPIRATDYSKAECDGRRVYTVGDKEYSECSFCGTICPARDLFHEPDSGLPLKCDLCESDPPQEEPLCVQACARDALTYEEKEVLVEAEDEAQVRPAEMELGLRSLIDKYGVAALTDTFARMKKG